MEYKLKPEKFVVMSVTNNSIALWGALLFSVLFIILWDVRVVKGEVVINPHDFQKEEKCERCHLPQSRELKFDSVTVCLRCHPSNLTDHVIDVVPKKAIVPDGLPLTLDGKMVCYTCHDYHNSSGLVRMLWVNYNDLCIACHVGY
ncbi:MAG: cytochrome c3 family protein [Thermodesulfobacteriota bacterium]